MNSLHNPTNVPLPTSTQVLVVGGGPVGQTLAVALRIRGVDTTVVDQQSGPADTSRAAVIHARTLEVLTDLGVNDELLRRGLIVPRFTVRDHDRALLSVDFRGLPSAHPYTLMCPQDVTERVLTDRLHQLGGQVHYEHQVVDVKQLSDHALATMADGRTVRAQYVVGTDGMHSTVRAQAGIGFPGTAYAGSFMLADVHLDWELPADEIQLFFATAGLMVVAPLPGGRHRVVATVDVTPEHPTRDDLQALLNTRGPLRTPAHVRDVVWGSRFHVHHRLADRYHAGRLVLAGDAAHVHSPAGGQGMNTGIQDAVALTRHLSALIEDESRQAELDAYEAERRPVATGVLSLTDQMTRVATVRSVPLQKLRNAGLRVLDRIPAARQAVAMNLAELSTDPNRDPARP
ncbi:FAD-dependent monooxygenase [Actinopolymorpha rutila]|uniref:2-polyprenyl-6-methoxyphenol hydroxylase-like FAD-dependent oxidoreductase n=1 Tax=Actinopolymorpha rutila TaxID=446787 RepID=A0A852ZJB3_9ACTN|nr:2-polyprenyl-6-methoxyphenol hydroxylase-like FAD-dependent oxidoreductase [Actinopolymorpha rutila]